VSCGWDELGSGWEQDGGNRQSGGLGVWGWSIAVGPGERFMGMSGSGGWRSRLGPREEVAQCAAIICKIVQRVNSLKKLLVVPSNLEDGYLSRKYWQGRGGQGG